MIKCSLFTATGRAAISLRRYVTGPDIHCPSPMGYHDASHHIQDAPVEQLREHGYWNTPRGMTINTFVTPEDEAAEKIREEAYQLRLDEAVAALKAVVGPTITITLSNEFGGSRVV